MKPIKFKIAVMKPDAQGNLKTFKKVRVDVCFGVYIVLWVWEGWTYTRVYVCSYSRTHPTDQPTNRPH